MGLGMKKQLGAKNCLYPLPTVLVGAQVNGKPNFIAMAHVGIADPGSISMGMSKSHFTNQGIKENGTFGVNIPSTKLMKETDYCGLVSGKKEDKAKMFKVFYGALKTAPMIEECPINMECELTHTFDFESHDIFVGKVVETYSDEDVLDSGVINFAKVDPLLFVMNDRGYWSLGRRLGSAWSVGMELKRKKATP